jgi:hypothetical protein
MKRYLLFGFDGYHPAGGWRDYFGEYETLEEAKNAAQARKELYDIVDTSTGSIRLFGVRYNKSIVWDKVDETIGQVPSEYRQLFTDAIRGNNCQYTQEFINFIKTEPGKSLWEKASIKEYYDC